MAIEIIPKKAEVKIANLFDVLFYLSLVLLIISILSCFVLGYFQKNSAKMLQNIKEALAQKETPELKALEKEVLGYQKKIEAVTPLFNAHQKSSNFFIFLEKLSHPKVFFSKLDLDVKECRASLSGKAQSFQALGQQLLVFKKERFIKDANLLKASIGREGEIEFSLGLSFNPQIFK